MATMRSVRSKVVGATVGAAAAGAMALILASPAHAVYGCEDLPSGGTSCGQVTTVPGSTTTTTTTVAESTTTVGSEVEGEVVEAAPPAQVAAEEVSSDTLPFTGVEIGGLVVLGGGLIAGGIFLSVAARRKAGDQS